MKKRFKILISMACMALTFALLGYGVYAASSVKLSMTGTFTFTTGLYTAYKGEAWLSTSAATSSTAVPSSGVTTVYGDNWTNTTNTGASITAPTSSSKSNGTMASWAPTFTFTETNKFVNIKITFYNYTTSVRTITVPTAPTITNVTVTWPTTALSMTAGSTASPTSVVWIANFQVTSLQTAVSGSFSSKAFTIT